MPRIQRPFEISAEELGELVAPYGKKFLWFAGHGYRPHLYQILFHTATHAEGLARFRHLVAGRRGGKTLSAAEEVIYYCVHPEELHHDLYGKSSDDPVWIWEISRNYKEGRPAWLTFLKRLRASGLANDKDYRVNRTERFVEFKNDSLVEFRSADDEDSLRGAGLDFIWLDEAAIIPKRGPWDVVRPALSDKLGGLITTTTPKGRNWFYEEFWSDKSIADPNHHRVEYWSLDNPHFPREEWEYLKDSYHPLLFKQEYMASFDAMIGVTMHGDWLHYYNYEDLPRKADGTLDLEFYLGVDPAISTSNTADYFAMALVGVKRDRSQAFLVDTYRARHPFPEQPDIILGWQNRPGLRPILTGIESVAYQAALAQQTQRLSSFPQVVPIFAKGKKTDRLISMTPLFRAGKIRIRVSHTDFIDEWLGYDDSLSHPHDDLLDAVEIALRTAGALIELQPTTEDLEKVREDLPARDMDELAQRDLAARFIEDVDEDYYDPELGDTY